MIERGLAAYRADSEAGASALHRLLERQHYRLAYWRVAVSAINYRRFFDINDLAGLRVEDPATFRAMHALVARLIAAGPTCRACGSITSTACSTRRNTPAACSS